MSPFYWLMFPSLVLSSLMPTVAGVEYITVMAIMKHLSFNNRRNKGAVNRATLDVNSDLVGDFKERYKFKAEILFINKFSPQQILDSICRTILERKVSGIFYLSEPNHQEGNEALTQYLIQIANFIGLPIVAWFGDNSGVIQGKDDSLIMQISPSINQQCNAMLAILRRYNWPDFCIITGSLMYNDYFIDVLRGYVDASDDWFNILAVAKIRKMRDEMIQTELKKLVSSAGRVMLLYASRQEAERILENAAVLGLTGNDYVWVVSNSAFLRDRRPPKEFPIGLLGIHYKTDADSNISTGIRVWANAIQNIVGDVTFRNLSIIPNMNCETERNIPWQAGEIVYNFMRNVSDPVSFREDGSVSGTELTIVNVRADHKWNNIGTWNSDDGKIRMDDITWPGNAPTPPRGRPEKYHLKVVTFEEEPYVEYSYPDSITGTCPPHSQLCRIGSHNETSRATNATTNQQLYRCCSGLCIDLLNHLSSEIGFDYELFEVEDKKWGAYVHETGEWNGLVRTLMDDKADMSMTSLKITPERSQQIDFSVPFLETGITIIVAVRDGVISPTAFLEPYDYPSWCVILVFSVHASGAAIFIFEWISPSGLDRGNRPIREHRFSLFRSFWLIWSMLFGAAVKVDNPRGVSSRWLGNIWALFAVVFTASYTANLAAFMITKEDFDRLTGIQDPRLKDPYKQKPPFKYATVPHGSTETTMMNNYPDMYFYMKSYNKRTVQDGVRAVKEGEINAFIYDATVLEFLAAHDDKCKLRTVGNWYAMTGYGIGFPKGSKWKDRINKHMVKLQYDGQMERLQKFWLAGACHKNKEEGQSSMPLEIPNFTSAFILLAAGMVLGGILLLLEHAYFKFGRARLRKIDRCGCCGLISLSMGQSLTFERSVIEAIDMQKNFKCKNPICETQIWKVKHELDLALLRIERLQEQLRKHGIFKQASSESTHRLDQRKSPAISWKDEPSTETVIPAQNCRQGRSRSPGGKDALSSADRVDNSRQSYWSPLRARIAQAKAGRNSSTSLPNSPMRHHLLNATQTPLLPSVSGTTNGSKPTPASIRQQVAAVPRNQSPKHKWTSRPPTNHTDTKYTALAGEYDNVELETVL